VFIPFAPLLSSSFSQTYCFIVFFFLLVIPSPPHSKDNKRLNPETFFPSCNNPAPSHTGNTISISRQLTSSLHRGHLCLYSVPSFLFLTISNPILQHFRQSSYAFTELSHSAPSSPPPLVRRTFRYCVQTVSPPPNPPLISSFPISPSTLSRVTERNDLSFPHSSSFSSPPVVTNDVLLLSIGCTLCCSLRGGYTLHHTMDSPSLSLTLSLAFIILNSGRLGNAVGMFSLLLLYRSKRLSR